MNTDKKKFVTRDYSGVQDADVLDHVTRLLLALPADERARYMRRVRSLVCDVTTFIGSRKSDGLSGSVRDSGAPAPRARAVDPDCWRCGVLAPRGPASRPGSSATGSSNRAPGKSPSRAASCGPAGPDTDQQACGLPPHVLAIVGGCPRTTGQAPPPPLTEQELALVLEDRSASDCRTAGPARSARGKQSATRRRGVRS